MPKLETRPKSIKLPPEPDPDFDADTSPVEPPEDDTAVEPAADPKPTTKAKPPARVKSKPATAAATTSLFASLDEMQDYYNTLYWGREGSAKTTNALAAANLGKVLVINAEGGLKKAPLIKRGINVANVMVYPPAGVDLSYEGLEEALLQVKSDLIDDPESWFAVVLDSITDVAETMVGKVSDDRVQKARKKGASVDLFDSFFVDRGDYGTSGKMVRTLIKTLRDLPCHFIVTALERRDVDEDTSKVTYGPAIPPGLQSDLLGYVDLVLHTKEADDDRDYYRAQTKRAGKYRAKDRFDGLPKVMVEPTFERVVGYLAGAIEESSDPLQKLVVEKPVAAKATGKIAGRKKTSATTPLVVAGVDDSTE